MDRGKGEGLGEGREGYGAYGQREGRGFGRGEGGIRSIWTEGRERVGEEGDFGRGRGGARLRCWTYIKLKFLFARRHSERLAQLGLDDGHLKTEADDNAHASLLVSASLWPSETDTGCCTHIVWPSETDTGHRTDIVWPSETDIGHRTYIVWPSETDTGCCTYIVWPSETDTGCCTHIVWPSETDTGCCTHIVWPSETDTGCCTHIVWPSETDTGHRTYIVWPSETDIGHRTYIVCKWESQHEKLPGQLPLGLVRNVRDEYTERHRALECQHDMSTHSVNKTCQHTHVVLTPAPCPLPPAPRPPPPTSTLCVWRKTCSGRRLSSVRALFADGSSSMWTGLCPGGGGGGREGGGGGGSGCIGMRGRP